LERKYEENLKHYVIKISLLIDIEEISIKAIVKHLEDKLKSIEGIYYSKIER